MRSLLILALAPDLWCFGVDSQDMGLYEGAGYCRVFNLNNLKFHVNNLIVIVDNLSLGTHSKQTYSLQTILFVRWLCARSLARIKDLRWQSGWS